MEEGCWKITKEMTVAEAVERFPKLRRALAELGMACCSCFGAESDTIEQVARVYGLRPEILVHTLNVAMLFPEETNLK
jgi:hybrid cluster-associated redox disulfide protein